MTLPTFDPIPFPTLNTEADGVDAFQDVSTVAGRNFDRFKQFWGGNRTRYAMAEQSRAASIYATIVNGASGNFVDIPAGQPEFPALTFQIPSWATIVWYQFFGYVSARDTGVGNWMMMTTQLTGSGLVVNPSPWHLGVYVRNYLYSGSRSYIWAPGQFNPGGTIVATPKVNWAGANSASQGTYYGNALVQFIAIG